MTALTIRIDKKLYPASAPASDAHLAIDGMAFDVEEHEFVCVLGPSGCGKTTMLNLIAGIDENFAGSITQHDHVPEHLAYVFQTPRLLPWRTAVQNVELVIDQSDPSFETALDLLGSVGIEKFADRYPGELSLGMQRRVSLARAFARKPSLLLMDEPFVSLDLEAANELRQLLRAILKGRPATVIFVTHDHREAVQLADRIVVLSAAPARVVKDVPVGLTASERRDAIKSDAFIERHLS